MYQPNSFIENRLDVLQHLIQAFPLATIVSKQDDLLTADHIPCYLDVTAMGNRLYGHVARGNPLWEISPNQEILVIFQGPQAYISPNWYPSKALTGKAVPTWNYAVIHVHGHLRAITDPLQLRAILAKLTTQHEKSQSKPWHLEDAPPDYLEHMVRAIVGLEIHVNKLVGKWKISQNRPLPEQQSVIEHLKGIPDPSPEGYTRNASQSMAVLMEQYLNMPK